MEVIDALTVVTRTGENVTITALPRRDEVSWGGVTGREFEGATRAGRTS